MPAQAKFARGVVDRYEALPLLNRERLGGIDTEANGFALRVKGIEVDMRNHAKGGLWAVSLELL
jgi:hypothetical protein